MASRDKEPAPPHHHQPLLSSLVVRPSHTELAAAGGGRAADFEPVELHRDPPPPYSSSHRYPDEPGYRVHAGSSSPVHRRDADHRFNSDYNHLSRSRGYGSGRDLGRYRDLSPPYGRGRVGGRPMGRAFDGPGFVSGLARGEGNSRNNPNVRPREGDWFCLDPLCGNLNFARRNHCNSCNRSRNAPARSPRRAYPAPTPFHAPPRCFPGPPFDHSPERTLNGYRSPPRKLARDGPREYGSDALPPLRHEGRFPDTYERRERMDYIEDAYRGRTKFERPPPLDWDNRDERKGFERRPLSPPAPLLPSLPNHRGGRLERTLRERSRTPIRVGPPLKEYRRDTFVNRAREDRTFANRARDDRTFVNRARDDRRGMGRDRIVEMY